MNRLYITIIAAFLAFYPWGVSRAQDAGGAAFLQNLSDIPLMPGLYEVLEEGMVFDKPGGRIAEAEATADDAQPTEIKAFYMKTLPQLGWRPAGSDYFIRESESLRIAVRDGDSGRVVHFTVLPLP